MASAQGRVRTPLTGDGILQLRADASGALVVPAVHVPIQGAQPPDHNLFLAGIASVRENGFMLVIPVAELVHQAVVDLEPEGGTEGGPMFYGGKIALLNSRGKAVGECDAELVDLPWGFAACLFPAVQFRGAQAQQFKVLGFVTEAGSAGKPSAESVAALAAQWVEEMDPQTAQEYLSAEEGQPVDLTDPDIISQLQARIIELESEVKRSQTTVPLLPGRSAGVPSQAPKAAGLFQGGPHKPVDSRLEQTQDSRWVPTAQGCIGRATPTASSPSHPKPGVSVCGPRARGSGGGLWPAGRPFETVSSRSQCRSGPVHASSLLAAESDPLAEVGWKPDERPGSESSGRGRIGQRLRRLIKRRARLPGQGCFHPSGSRLANGGSSGPCFSDQGARTEPRQGRLQSAEEIHGTEDSFGRPQDAQPLCHPGGRRVVNCSSEQQCGADGHYGADDDVYRTDGIGLRPHSTLPGY